MKKAEHPSSLVRVQVSELDAILGVPYKVLDDGFVRVVDYMGADQSIVQAARVSYGQGTKQISEDRGLIRYLMRHKHTTPFEMCEIKLHVRVPMDCWRQWIRHRTANVNEYSTRYSVAIDSAQRTEENSWRTQSVANKQGSVGVLDIGVGQQLTNKEALFHQQARDLYEERIQLGVAREQARKDLPLSTYTEAYWKVDLHNLLHFLKLRMDPHAQLEIRQYAEIIGKEFVARWCPLSWSAFLDYQFNSMSLSTFEQALVRLIAGGDLKAAESEAREYGILQSDPETGLLLKSRERDEIEARLRFLNLPVPWYGAEAK